MKHANINLIKEELNQFYGSEQFYHSNNKRAVYTEGARAYFKMGTYWLNDIIEFELFKIMITQIPDIYYLTFEIEDSKGKLILKDYQDQTIWTKEIPWTDHPEGSIKLYIGFDGYRVTTCLPSEN